MPEKSIVGKKSAPIFSISAFYDFCILTFRGEIHRKSAISVLPVLNVKVGRIALRVPVLVPAQDFLGTDELDAVQPFGNIVLILKD